MFKTTNQVILRDMFIQYGIGTFPLPPEALLQAAGTVSGKNGLITPCPFALHIGVLHHQPLKLSWILLLELYPMNSAVPSLAPDLLA